MEEDKVVSFNEISKISCPHCGEEQGYEYDNGLITYWGEEVLEMECCDCGKKFFIQECVLRDWDVAKNIDDL
jgi:C4-type Zn-finger protein